MSDQQEDHEYAVESMKPTPAPSSVPTLTRYESRIDGQPPFGAYYPADDVDAILRAQQEAQYSASQRELIQIAGDLQERLHAAADMARVRDQEMKVTEELLATRQQLLNLFDCPVHGSSCVPHAIEEVKSLRARDQALREKIENLQNDIKGLAAAGVVGHGYVLERLGHLLTGPDQQNK